MDAATAAAVAALVVACLALFIAFAQVLQQYFQTGQLIRLCDSVVYGPMPGTGHRHWVSRQFRFRIVYAVPQLCVAPYLWPNAPPTMGSFKTGQYSLVEVDFSASSPSLRKSTFVRVDAETTVQHVDYDTPKSHKAFTRSSKNLRSGEASWVSFSRLIQRSCGRAVFYDLIEYDADRCPVDLPNVPMQISMRDVVVMGMFAHMKCISADYKRGLLLMQGPEGSIISSTHPILGPLIRFTPRSGAIEQASDCVDLSSGFGTRIEQKWIWRTIDACGVAGGSFSWIRRRLIRRDAGVWTRYTFKPGQRKYKDIIRVESTKDKNSESEGAEKHETIRRHHVVLETGIGLHQPELKLVGRGIRDGDWKTEDLIYRQSIASRKVPVHAVPHPPTTSGEAPSHPTAQPPATSKSSSLHKAPHESMEPDKAYLTPNMAESTNYRPPRAQSVSNLSRNEDDVSSFVGDDVNPTVPSSDNEKTMGQDINARVQMARDRQAERRAKMELEENDENIVDELVARGILQAPYQDGPLLITYPTNEDGDVNVEDAMIEATAEQLEANDREQERLRQREERDQERRDRWNEKNRDIGLGNVDWFWMSQTNIFHGPWATPWGDDINIYDCIGGIAVFLEALLGFFDDSSILYGDARDVCGLYSQSTFRQTASWMLDGNYTCPSYAWNSQGGIIPSGTLFLFQMPCFKAKIPALELLYSYDWQSNAWYQDPVTSGNNLNTELMRLDAWLSYVGRLPEIAGGRSKLLSQTPALVQLIIENFQLEFSDVETSATEGGLQEIQGLAANVMDFLTDEQLTEAEQVYILVACLRTMKVGRLIYNGPDTRFLRDVLENDTQVHMI